MNVLLSRLNRYILEVKEEVSEIDSFRKNYLDWMAKDISKKIQLNFPVSLMFVCTHNSRRSHLSQAWAQCMSHYFEFRKVRCYSGGTKETAFYPSAAAALENAGFIIEKSGHPQNPIYEVYFASGAEPLRIFSKKYNHPFNPKSGFVAVVNCSRADESCPQIEGALSRHTLIYKDPKEFDESPLEQSKYQEKCREIARDQYYLFDRCRKFIQEGQLSPLTPV
ncbi:MAG: protein-tyrosine-phosphatase [Bacteroidota bacterium]